MATTRRTRSTSSSNGNGSHKVSAQPRLGQRAPEIQRFGTLRQLPIALSAEARTESCQILNEILADSMVLAALYKKSHWNAAGPTFYQLHLLFDKHYEEQVELVDALAERVQMLGGISVGDPRHAAELTTDPPAARWRRGGPGRPVPAARRPRDDHREGPRRPRQDRGEQGPRLERPADGRRPPPPRDAGLVPGRARRRGAARRSVGRPLRRPRRPAPPAPRSPGSPPCRIRPASWPRSIAQRGDLEIVQRIRNEMHRRTRFACRERSPDPEAARWRGRAAERRPATLAAVTHRTAAQLLVECLAAEGCEYVFSVPGEETMDVLDALGAVASAAEGTAGPRHVTTRHEQGAAFMADVYGRLTGRAAVAMATLGPGATNLITGIADAFLDRAPMVAITGQALVRQAPQGGPPGRRRRPDDRARHEVEHPRRAGRGDPRDRPQGVPGRRPREARADPHRAARERRRDAPIDDDARPLMPGKAYFPEPTDEAIAHAAELIATSRAAARPGRQRRPPAARRAGAAGVRPRAARPGRGHVHGQGRDGRPVAPVADGGRAPGARPRPVGLRPGRPRDLRRLRPRRVRAGPLEPGRPQADRPHRHPAGRGRRASTGPRSSSIGDIDGSLRRLLAAVLPRGISGRDAGERHEARETLVHADLRTALLAELAECRIGRQRRPADHPAAGDRRPARGPRPGGHRRVRRRRPQGLGRPAVPGLRAEHRDHLERLRGDGHLAAGRDRRQARPSRSARSSRCAATAAS